MGDIMNKHLTAAGALLASATMVNAAGLDRSGQDVSVIFEDGNYFQLSYGNVNPTVTGVHSLGGPKAVS